MLPPSAVPAKCKKPTCETEARLLGDSNLAEDEPLKKQHKRQKGSMVPTRKSTRNTSLVPTDN